MSSRQSALIQRANAGQASHRKRWIAQVIPSASEQRDLMALATSMSGLALPKQLIALELVAQTTKTGVRRSFLVRAQSLEGRKHLCGQLQEHYPQATIRYLAFDEDPLVCGPGEAVSCVSLRLGAPSYLPLRTWERKSLEEDGTDPLLNVLAALKGLPPRYRTVVQLVLTPASNTWSRRSQRFAQEHPLEEERFHRQQLVRAQMQTTRSVEQSLFLEGLGIVLLFILAGYWIWQPLQSILPAWVLQAGSALVQGQPQHLSAWQIVQLALGGSLLLASLIGLGIVVMALRNLLGQTWRPRRMYDPALVRAKTERIAYQAELRLYVVGPRPLFNGQKLHLFSRFSSLIVHLRTLNGIARWQEVGRFFQTTNREGRQWLIACWLLGLRQIKAAKTRAAIIASLTAAFRAYHLASGNFFVQRKTSGWVARRRLSPGGDTKRSLGSLWFRPDYLTPDEVASLFHLIQSEDLRNATFLERGRAKTLPVPEAFTDGTGEPFAQNIHKGERKPVFFQPGGLAYNLLALAGTGKGKSTLFAHLALVLFFDFVRRGCVLLDPHGDLARAFLRCVPLARRDDVIFLDLADRLNPPGINFLDMSAGQDRDRVVDTLLSTFKSFWRDNWGSRIENTFQMCMLTICDLNTTICRRDKQNGPSQQYTILTIIPLLQQPNFRKQLIKEIWDPTIKDWWYGYYLKQKEDDQLEIAASVITKLSKFSASKIMRRIVGQPVSTVSLPNVITNGQLLIVSTASGVVGDDTSTLFGSMLLGLLHTCIAEQANQAQGDRVPMYLFIDELQKFSMGVNLNAMIAELRKYGGNFALATQSFGFLDGLDPTLRHTLLANTDQLFAFDMAAEDAESMAQEMGDGLSAEDILSLDNFACYAKLTHLGHRWPTFSLELFPQPPGDSALVDVFQMRSAQKYATPAKEVDRYLMLQNKLIKSIVDAPQEPSSPQDDDGLTPDFESIDRDDQKRKKERA